MGALHPFMVQKIPHAEFDSLFMMPDKPAIGVVGSIICQIGLPCCIGIGYRAGADKWIAALLTDNVRIGMGMATEESGVAVRIDDRVQRVVVRNRIVILPSACIGIGNSILERFMYEDKGSLSLGFIFVQQ